jgi:hypothetical protein
MTTAQTMTTATRISGAVRPALQTQYASGRPAGKRIEGDLVRDAFRRRASQAVEYMAASASLEALARALEAPTDFGAVASALGSSAIPASAVDLDPLADALARGVEERARLATQAGGLLSVAEAGQALGEISRQAVDKRRRANHLLAVRVAGDWRYPAAQIGPDGQVPALLSAVLDDGVQLGMSGWAMLDFLLAPDDALGGVSPIDVLRREGRPEAAGGAAVVRRLLAAAKADAFG